MGRLFWTTLGALFLLAACAGSSAQGTGSTSSKVIAACTVPAAASGCSAQTVFQMCNVPLGATVSATGTITAPDGGSVSCADACSTSEYYLTCTDTSAASALNCRTLTIPTPANVTYYCCPCGS
jgi:hypothetical protein